ncbi:MAG: hypothetical protein JWQ28_2915, partial [Pedobacter sp.]|nr:hypothetical protein [Pedobacter sp.]
KEMIENGLKFAQQFDKDVISYQLDAYYKAIAGIE